MMQTRYRMLCCMYISAMQHHCCNGLFAWTSVDCKHDWWPRRRRGWVGILWAAHLPLSLLLRRLAVPRWASWDLTAWLIIQPLEVIAYVFKVQYAACSTVLLVPVWFSIHKFHCKQVPCDIWKMYVAYQQAITKQDQYSLLAHDHARGCTQPPFIQSKSHLFMSTTKDEWSTFTSLQHLKVQRTMEYL